MSFPPDWELSPLQDCLSALIDYRGKTPEKTSSGVPLITAKVVKNGRIETPNEFIAEEDYDAWMTRGLPEPRDVVITTEAPLGEVAQLGNERIALAQRIILLRGNRQRLDNTYLKYCLSADYVQSQLHGRASGTTVTGIKQSELRKIEIALPPIAEQKNIAEVLQSLDDKIELNRRMNATLEAMARALFKSWFVDFDLIKAKAKELISEGVLEIGDGYRAKNDELGEPGLPFIRVANLNDGFDTVNADRLRDASVAKAGTKISCVGDVAFTSKGTIGRFARVEEKTERFVYSPQVCFWRSLNTKKLHPALLYCWMQSNDFRSQVLAVAGQTDMAPYVSLRDQREMWVPRFPASQIEIGASIEALLVRKSMNEAESRTLASLRDTLLPKLISGQLRIPEVGVVIG